MITIRRPLLGAGVLAGLAVAVLLGAAGWTGEAVAPPAPFADFDPGPVTRWGLPLVRLAGTLSAIAATGALLGVSMLAGSAGARPDTAPTAAALRRWAPVFALAAACAQVLQVVLAVSAAAGRPVHAVPAGEFVTCLGLAGNVYCLAGAAVFLGLAAASRTTAPAPHLLLTAMVATAVPFLGGHSSSAAHHTVNVGLVVVHVLTASLWVGGLATLLLIGAVVRDPVALRLVLPAFSRLAGGCAVAVLLTGLAAAVVRTPAADRVSPDYLVLLAIKAVFFVALCCFGAWHRRHTVRPDRRLSPATGGAFLRAGSAEIAVMIAVVAVATVLSQTAPEAVP